MLENYLVIFRRITSIILLYLIRSVILGFVNLLGGDFSSMKIRGFWRAELARIFSKILYSLVNLINLDLRCQFF